MSIKQLLDSVQTVPDAPCRVDDHELSEIVVVGRVNARVQAATNITYNFDDGTGVIDGKRFLDADSAEQFQDNITYHLIMQ